jgi:predicted glycosyltransferase
VAKGIRSKGGSKKKSAPPTGRLLFAVLNWGLGHAARSIPLIKAAEKQGFEVVIASDGGALELLQLELPGRHFLTLPGYDIRYTKGKGLTWYLLFQSPRVWRVVQREHALVQQWVTEYNLCGIVSDNRFGCYSASVPSVCVSHQLHIEAGWLGGPVNMVNRRFLKPFDALWVPDVAERKQRISGKLSRNTLFKQPVTYLGILSRFKHRAEGSDTGKVLALLSGPEPQRTQLEAMIMAFVRKHPHYMQWHVVRGMPTPSEELPPPHVQVDDMLTAEGLKQALIGADLVVARSGYSTLMDLAMLGKKALLIPTPGQTEQVYLARRMKKKGWVHTVEQTGIQWMREIDWALKLPGFPDFERGPDQPKSLFKLFAEQTKK